MAENPDLNHERATEEKQGVIRWLRPEFQDPEGRHYVTQGCFVFSELLEITK